MCVCLRSRACSRMPMMLTYVYRQTCGYVYVCIWLCVCVHIETHTRAVRENWMSGLLKTALSEASNVSLCLSLSVDAAAKKMTTSVTCPLSLLSSSSSLLLALLLLLVLLLSALLLSS